MEANPRVLGALTPRITELNLDYFGQMWPTNASAGSGYGAALNTATAALAAPPPPANAAISPEAPVRAAAAVSEAVGRTAAGAAMRGAYGAVQAAAAVTQGGAGVGRAMVPPPAPAPPTKSAEMRPPPTPSSPPVGMYQQPPSNAAVYGPPVSAGAQGAPAGMRPGPPGGPATGSAPATVTSYVRPSEPFAMPTPPGGYPGILSAAAVQPPPVVPPAPAQLQPMNPPVTSQPAVSEPASSPSPDPVEPSNADGGMGDVHGLSVHNSEDVHQRVDPLPPGRQPHVKVLMTPEQIRIFYENLTENATRVPGPPSYPGEWQVLEDGTRIAYRENSKFGGPTIEIQYPDGEKVDIHLEERPKTPQPQPRKVPVPAPEPAPAPAPSREPTPVEPPAPSIRVPPLITPDQIPPPEQNPGIWAIIGGILLAGGALLLA